MYIIVEKVITFQFMIILRHTLVRHVAPPQTQSKRPRQLYHVNSISQRETVELAPNIYKRDAFPRLNLFETRGFWFMLSQ